MSQCPFQSDNYLQLTEKLWNRSFKRRSTPVVSTGIRLSSFSGDVLRRWQWIWDLRSTQEAAVEDKQCQTGEEGDHLFEKVIYLMKPSTFGITSEDKTIFFFPCSHSPPAPKIFLPYLGKVNSGKMQVSKCRWSSYPHITQTPSNKSMKFGWFPAPANQATWISLQTLSWMEPYRAHTALILTRAPILCTNTHIHETEHHPYPTLPICSLPTSRLEYNSLWLKDWTDLWANPDFCPTPLNHCSLTGPSWSWLFCGHKNALLLFSVLSGMGTPAALSHRARTHPLWHWPTGKWCVQRGLGTQQTHLVSG